MQRECVVAVGWPARGLFVKAMLRWPAGELRIVCEVPRVGVVVVGFNSNELRCLVSHRCASPPRGDRQREQRRRRRTLHGDLPLVEFVRLGTNVGFAAANNLGIEMLHDYDFIALMNPDAFAEDTWLEGLLVAAEAHPDFASFASTIERADVSGRLESAGDAYHVYGTAWPSRGGVLASATLPLQEVFGASGAAALYRREWLARVGGFDDRFFCYFEDVDFGRDRVARHPRDPGGSARRRAGGTKRAPFIDSTAARTGTRPCRRSTRRAKPAKPSASGGHRPDLDTPAELIQRNRNPNASDSNPIQDATQEGASLAVALR